MNENHAHSDQGAGVLCLWEKKVLLVQMNYGSFIGDWILPGGMVEKGEHPHEAAIREAKEETNLDIELIKLLTVRHRIKEKGLDNTYWVFTGHVKTQNPEKNLQWAQEELLSVRFWDVQTALKENSVRPHTKYYIEVALGMKTNAFLSPLAGAANDYCYSL